ncbi:hydroxyethylthiazole kinase [Cytobacillus sp. FJAT-54145]|uniref:Hydroxyethylthiazole kinase n=1 Tax=Cytobacillus spartinae TaxID=3299023 RepID=A0ABW6K7P9_9BACI
MKCGEIKHLFKLIKDNNPLVHHITNQVTINDCANVTLAIGASPVMADYTREVEEIVSKADALLLNLGTFNEERYQSMKVAGKKANQLGIPIVFDPVGVGASSFRKNKALELLKEIDICIIRGNYAEVSSLVGLGGKAKGVDSVNLEESSNDVIKIAKLVATAFDSIVVISGEIDVVTNGQRACIVENGDEWLSKISGTGCASGSLIASFSAVTNDYYLAAVAGISTMGVCGERAKKALEKADGLGTYRVKLMDQLSSMDGDTWGREVRIYEVEYG